MNKCQASHNLLGGGDKDRHKITMILFTVMQQKKNRKKTQNASQVKDVCHFSNMTNLLSRFICEFAFELQLLS